MIPDLALSPADLAAYLARIGFAGTPVADRPTLNAIAALHPAAIPFENLDPLLGKPAQLEREALVAKLVHGGRGGYCFEQNGLLWRALAAIGFTVSGLAARVLWNHPAGTMTPRSHKLLRVDLAQGAVVVDAGFGYGTPTAPIDLVEGVAQPTPHEPFRLLREAGYWHQQVLIEGEWRSTCRFDLVEQWIGDYAAANWWASTGPGSPFHRKLVAARALPGKRLALRGLDYVVQPVGAPAVTRRLALEEVPAVLAEDFGIALPDCVALAQRLAMSIEA